MGARSDEASVSVRSCSQPIDGLREALRDNLPGSVDFRPVAAVGTGFEGEAPAANT